MTFTFCRRDKNLIKSHVIMTFANVRLGATPSEWAAIGDPNNAKQLTKFTNSAGVNCKIFSNLWGQSAKAVLRPYLCRLNWRLLLGFCGKLFNQFDSFYLVPQTFV